MQRRSARRMTRTFTSLTSENLYTLVTNFTRASGAPPRAMDFHACRRGATPGNDDAVRCRLAARLDPEEKRKPVALPRAVAGVPDVLEIRSEAEVGRENRRTVWALVHNLERGSTDRRRARGPRSATEAGMGEAERGDVSGLAPEPGRAVSFRAALRRGDRRSL